MAARLYIFLLLLLSFLADASSFVLGLVLLPLRLPYVT
jgi:hypothetical protein